jgi:hypothetical protein
MEKLKIIFLFCTTLMLYNSCKKNDTQKDPDSPTLDSATIMGFKDSTQLIKSIHRIDYDSTGAFRDSSTIYLYYDTVNRKVTIRSGRPVTTDEYSYNSSGLLVHFEQSGDTSAVASIDYTYDASNILKTASVNDKPGGNSYVYSINKTLLSSGNYQLSWLDTDPAVLPDSNYYLVNFDNKGKLLSYYDTGIISDSIIYDANENISKVEETFYTTRYNANGSTSFTLYDFLSRDTKGDQLYNLFQILNNGVANIPPDIAVFGATGDMGFFYQLRKYPTLSTNINRPVGDEYCAGCAVHVVNFNNAPQYDSQNRLVKYSTFFNDAEVYRIDYIIGYYK